MAGRKFSGINGTVDTPAVAEDYASAHVFGSVRVGRLGVYYRDGFINRFIDFASMERAFIRIHEVSGKLCCGSTTFQYFRLVMVSGGKEIADVISEDGKAMDDALECIHLNAPAVEIGVDKK